MNYDDTVERLAKAVASQINTVKEYKEVMNKLDAVKDTNQYAMAMKNYITIYTNKNIVIASFETEEKKDNIIPKKEFILKRLLSNKNRKNYKS